MDVPRTPRFLRATVIAGIGALATVILSIGIGVFLVQPKEASSSLATRVAGKSTIFFMRTDSLSPITDLLGSSVQFPPVINQFSLLHGLEIAIHEAGTGGNILPWKMEARAAMNDPDTTIQIISTVEDSIQKPGKDSPALTSSSFFRLHAPAMTDSGTSMMYVQIKDAPALFNLSQQPILHSIVQPFSDALLTWTNTETNEAAGTLWLKPWSPINSRTSAYIDERDAAGTASGIVLDLHVTNPYPLLAAFNEALMRTDPAFAEGLKGIAAMKLQKFTAQSDIDAMGTDLLSAPVELRIGTINNGTRPFLFAGRARSVAVLDRWIGDMMATATPGVVRSLPLMRGDRRIDVSMGEPSPTEKSDDGWSIRTIGEASDAPLFMAEREKAYVLSNDRSWITKYIANEQARMGAMQSDSGIMDIREARTFMQREFPILGDLLTNPLLPANRDGIVRWNIRTTPGSVAVGWTWKNAQ